MTHGPAYDLDGHDLGYEQTTLLPGPERLQITLTPQLHDGTAVHLAWQGVFDDEPRRVVGCFRFGDDALVEELLQHVREWLTAQAAERAAHSK